VGFFFILKDAHILIFQYAVSSGHSVGVTRSSLHPTHGSNIMTQEQAQTACDAAVAQGDSILSEYSHAVFEPSGDGTADYGKEPLLVYLGKACLKEGMKEGSFDGLMVRTLCLPSIYLIV
jgi:hypothetical protein